MRSDLSGYSKLAGIPGGDVLSVRYDGSTSDPDVRVQRVAPRSARAGERPPRYSKNLWVPLSIYNVLINRRELRFHERPRGLKSNRSFRRPLTFATAITYLRKRIIVLSCHQRSSEKNQSDYFERWITRLVRR